LVTRLVALQAGMSDRQIEGRVRTGRWERLAPGVYRIAGSPDTDAARAYAAVLAAGDDAVASSLTSLALVGLCPMPDPLTICSPPTGSARSRLAVVRRSPLQSADRARVGPIPCTTPARALLEAAAVVSVEQLQELLDDAIDRRIVTVSGVIAAIRRSATGKGRAGSLRLRHALQPWLEGIRPGSPAEVRLLRRIDDWGLPAPVRQYEVELPSGLVRLDLAWPSQLAGIEYDGERWHNPRRLSADVEREEQLRALGWWIGRADRHDLAPSSTRLRDELVQRVVRSRPAA
jgi:hypothetical protein